MFLICASTANSSIRVGCDSPVHAEAKLRELEQTWRGEVQVFDFGGKLIRPEDLSAMALATWESDA